MLIRFFMPMHPPTKTHQMKSVKIVKGKPVFYEDAELKAVRSKLTAHLAKHKPDKPLEGPVTLLTVWNFYTDKTGLIDTPKITRPDTDNIVKMLKDCMTDLGFWKDDAQVWDDHIKKVWSDTPGIFIAIESIEEFRRSEDSDA